MQQSPRYELFICALEALAARPVRNHADLNEWYREARRLEERITSEGIEVPHFVWHYLADADIRLKDAEYGGSQDRELSQVIQGLRSQFLSPAAGQSSSSEGSE